MSSVTFHLSGQEENLPFSPHSLQHICLYPGLALWCVPVDLQQRIMLEGLESTSAGTAAGLRCAQSVTSAQSDKYRSEQICLNTAVVPKSWHSPAWGRFVFRSLDDFWFYSHDSLLGICSGHFVNANLDMLKHSHTLLTSSSGRDQGRTLK